MIKIHNDGKEKWQSFRASIDLEIHTKDSFQTFDFDGYGKDEDEAIQNMKSNIGEAIKAIKNAYDSIDGMLIKQVDYKGDEIK